MAIRAHERTQTACEYCEKKAPYGVQDRCKTCNLVLCRGCMKTHVDLSVRAAAVCRHCSKPDSPVAVDLLEALDKKTHRSSTSVHANGLEVTHAA